MPYFMVNTITIDNIVQVGIRNGDVISVGANSFMHSQSSLQVCLVLVTGSESSFLYKI